MEQMLLLPVIVPILAGIVLLFKKEFKQRKMLLVFVGSVLLICDNRMDFSRIFFL